MSYMLINKMTTKPGKRDDVIKILLDSGSAFDNNDSCYLYLVSKDAKDDSVIWVQDIWKDNKSHQEAMNDETMKEYIQQAMPLLDGMPEQIELKDADGKHPFNLDK
jgi:quinol monooxygenase YgiN